MAKPRTAGIDKRANPLYHRHSDGQLKLVNDRQKIIDDQIAALFRSFRE